ncbi:MAG: hypothetical protein CMF44_05470 [Legionellales bacterium]|nr:hypothetical protein [Legionellales bacterium]MBK68395.1 hypothetical protein [Legionellales bacterium]
MSLTVIKLGGSLMRSSELQYWLNSIFQVKRNSILILVPGGGEFADSIRKIQNNSNFNDEIAHKLALLAMAQYGYFLTSINSNIKIIRNINNLSVKKDSYNSYLWLPDSLLDDSLEIPKTWDITSDSISLWLATKLFAKKLIIIKSKKITLNKSKITEHGQSNDLDKGFASMHEKYQGDLFCLHKSEYNKLESILSEK